MSLVSDALKKAQREAALREASAKGLPEPLVSAAQPYRARRRNGLRPVWIALGAVVLLAAGSFVALRLARPPAGPEGAAASAPAPPSAAVQERVPATSAEAPQIGEAAPGTAATSEPNAVPWTSNEGRTAALRTAEAIRPEPRPDPPSVEDTDRPGEDLRSGTASALSPPAPEAHPVSEERVFGREANLGNGLVFKLGGIAWSEVAPLAYLNGRLAGIGESVSGWRVERIERERVTLAGPSGRIVLSLR